MKIVSSSRSCLIKRPSGINYPANSDVYQRLFIRVLISDQTVFRQWSGFITNFIHLRNPSSFLFTVHRNHLLLYLRCLLPVIRSFWSACLTSLWTPAPACLQNLDLLPVIYLDFPSEPLPISDLLVLNYKDILHTGIGFTLWITLHSFTSNLLLVLRPLGLQHLGLFERWLPCLVVSWPAGINLILWA